MNLIKKIKVGSVIEICGIKYDVLNISYEIDRADFQKDGLIGEHIAIELHKFGDLRLHATHLLKMYLNNDEFFLSEIFQEKPSEEPRAVKQRGNIFSYQNEEKIYLKNIKLN